MIAMGSEGLLKLLVNAANEAIYHGARQGVPENRRMADVSTGAFQDMVQGRYRAEYLAVALANCLEHLVPMLPKGNIQNATAGLDRLIPDWRNQISAMKDRWRVQ